jgi:hypothetical protein
MFFWQVCALGFGFFTRPKHPENATWIKNIARRRAYFVLEKQHKTSLFLPTAQCG